MKNIFDNQVYESIVENSIDAVIIINQSGDIIYWNAAAESLFGYSSSEVLGKYVHDILPPQDLREKANESFNIFKSKGTGPLIGTTLLIRGLKKNGDEFHVQFSPNTIKIKEELYIFAFLRDVSEAVSLQEKLTHQATIDDLTGILNRRAFSQQAETAHRSAVRHKEPFSLLMMDIDFFKKINDQYGHHTGDIALQAFTKNISNIIRSEDIFGRVGGEEFFLFLLKTPKDAALKVAEKIRFTTDNLTITASNISIKMTVSIGVTSIHNGNDSLQQIQNRCDEALYKAKKTGRNCVVLSDS